MGIIAANINKHKWNKWWRKQQFIVISASYLTAPFRSFVRLFARSYSFSFNVQVDSCEAKWVNAKMKKLKKPKKTKIHSVKPINWIELCVVNKEWLFTLQSIQHNITKKFIIIEYYSCSESENSFIVRWLNITKHQQHHLIILMSNSYVKSNQTKKMKLEKRVKYWEQIQTRTGTLNKTTAKKVEKHCKNDRWTCAHVQCNPRTLDDNIW